MGSDIDYFQSFRAQNDPRAFTSGLSIDKVGSDSRYFEEPSLVDKGITAVKDFFGKETSLTVSGQLEAETYALGLGEVYTFGPTFRAENSNTSRHLAEFWMIEPEMAFTDLQGMLLLTEEFLKHVIGVCLERHEEDLEFLQKSHK